MNRSQPIDRSDYPTRRLRLGDPEPNDLASTTPAERLAMVWPLTRQAWAFMEGLEGAGTVRGAAADLTAADLQKDDLVFQIGVPPRRIDILTSITGVEFGEAWEERESVDYEGLEIPVLGREHLIRNKRAVGRTRDLADIEELEAADDSG